MDCISRVLIAFIFNLKDEMMILLCLLPLNLICCIKLLMILDVYEPFCYYAFIIDLEGFESSKIYIRIH
jgi:hypothetical protein